MTDDTPTRPAPRPAPRPARSRPSLYRTVLGLGVAALAAAWLPFSFFYINALNKPPTPVTAIQGARPAGATPGPKPTTRVSGAAGPSAATPVSSASTPRTPAVTAVTTRTS